MGRSRLYFIRLVLLLTVCVPFVSSVCTKDGQQIVLNNTWFACIDGEPVPIACLAPDGTKVDLNQLYLVPGYVVKCLYVGSGHLDLVRQGCHINGQLITPGFTAHDDKYWYSCENLPNKDITINITGCLGDNETVISFGSIFCRNKTTLYKCSGGRESFMTITPYACVYDNEQYLINEEFCSCGFWHKCLLQNNSSTNVSVLGCCHDGKKMRENEAVMIENKRLFICRLENKTITV